MTEPSFKLDIAAPQRRFTDREKYTVYVLWLIGFSASSIATVVGIDRKKVLNMVNRSEYAGRSAMPDERRKTFLRELQEIRFEDGVAIDGGKLDRIRWELLPITGKKRRPARRAA
jgi:hypothetical protein